MPLQPASDFIVVRLEPAKPSETEQRIAKRQNLLYIDVRRFQPMTYFALFFPRRRIFSRQAGLGDSKREKGNLAILTVWFIGMRPLLAMFAHRWRLRGQPFGTGSSASTANPADSYNRRADRSNTAPIQDNEPLPTG